MNPSTKSSLRKLKYLLVILSLLSGESLKSAIPDSIVTSEKIRVSTFDIDATPPKGSFLAYGTVNYTWDMSLRARGIVITGAEDPIVLCSVDWIGIGNEGHDLFCEEIARAAGTTPERVAIHTVHQHDTPWCDLGAEKVLLEAGLPTTKYESTFTRSIIISLANEIKNSLDRSIPITEIGYGQADVYKVASNRRILGEDGKIRAHRLSATLDSALRAEPEGLIDPAVSVISFWNGNQPVAVLSYYAVHPQSYYRTNITNPDFPGIARFMRQLEQPQALHIHFNGAGGNIAASKYNDGSPENRGIFAFRLADGMKRAWEATKRIPISANQVKWDVESVALPPAEYLTMLQDENFPKDSLLVKSYPSRLAWLRRCQAGKTLQIGCLYLDKIRILHLPGEPFVEFQLAAKAVRKDLFIAVAGYGDYGPGYIGTSRAYEEGGYETSYVSNVTPDAEGMLLRAIKTLLNNDLEHK